VTLYVIDNGCQYSDHAIYFVQSPASEEDVRWLLGLLNGPEPYCPWTLVMTATGGELTWAKNMHPLGLALLAERIVWQQVSPEDMAKVFAILKEHGEEDKARRLENDHRKRQEATAKKRI
jgi:hypothetical protein